MPRPERFTLRAFVCAARACGVALLLMLPLSGCHSAVKQHDMRLVVKVLYGDPQTQHTDSRARQLLATLPAVPQAGYTLRDEAEFHLEPNSTGRLQLPDGSWLNVVPLGESDAGQARLAVEMGNVQLKTNVLLSVGTTVAIGGSPFGRGHLLVAIRYL